jgi:hypothetical protein
MIKKATLTTDNNHLQIGVPFSKVDQENRIVSGFATLDNVDATFDVVTAEASLKAFELFRGNVREQHLPIAAGRVVDFYQKDFYDNISEKMHTGIFVDVYVSKGAPDTWEKILDGTLSGFSIGGAVNNSRSEYIPDLEKTVTFITDYTLIELSLVDSPMNKLCNIFSITKIDDSMKATGIATTTSIENVFWCETDGVAVAIKEDSTSCSLCKQPMTNAGWFESISGDDKTQKLRKVLDTFGIKKNEMKGGFGMAEEVKATETTVADEEKVEKVEVPAGETKVVKDEETSLSQDEEDFHNLTKAIDEIKGLVQKYNETDANRESTIVDIRTTVGDFQKSVEGKFEDLLNKHNELAESFKAFKDGLSQVEKRLDGVESETAVKKSNEVKEQDLRKKDSSPWSGAFLPIE